MKVVLFASKYVGLEILRGLASTYKDDVLAVVHIPGDQAIVEEAMALTSARVFSSEELQYPESDFYQLRPDLVILAWWPQIIPRSYYAQARLGAINTHNSLLPYCRGVAPNYWAIRNNEPYGVTLHKVVDGVDAGAIVAQVSVEVSWTETGETVYWRGLRALVDLFFETYPNLEERIRHAVAQDDSEATEYRWRDLPDSYLFGLDEPTTARELLNLIRAKQFSGQEQAYFAENGRRFAVTVSICEVLSNE